MFPGKQEGLVGLQENIPAQFPVKGPQVAAEFTTHREVSLVRVRDSDSSSAPAAAGLWPLLPPRTSHLVIQPPKLQGYLLPRLALIRYMFHKTLKHVLAIFIVMTELSKYTNYALVGVAQWIDGQPVNQRVTGLILSQGTGLGCGPGPQ